MKRLTFLVVLSSVCQTQAALTGGETLFQTISARAQGMGEAYSSVPAIEGGIASLHYNPASLGSSQSIETSLTFKRGVSDDNFAAVTVGNPSRFGNLAGSFLYYAVGNINLIDTSGNKRSVNAQKDMAVFVSYGKKLADNLSLGINGKYLRSQLVESFTANAYAADLGIQYQRKPFAFGFAVQNLGTKIKYNQSEDDLPQTYRAGVSYGGHWFKKNHKILAALDTIKKKGEDTQIAFGFEYLLEENPRLFKSTFAIRSGYKTGQDQGNLSFGLGFYVGRYRLDYAMQLIGGTSNSHLVTLGFLF